MGLTNHATGRGAWDSGLTVVKRSPEDRVIALAGNPNVGKSTLFNGLTGMNQHTGNWPGKTVANAQGHCSTNAHDYVLVDIPGTYSLLAHSAEEEVARDFLCFSQPDAVVVVCDATCLERNLNLVLQILELSTKVIVCVNLMDEARRKGILLDLERLSNLLGVPVVSTVAQCKASQATLMDAVDQVMDGTLDCTPHPVTYPPEIERALSLLEPELTPLVAGTTIQPRWLALQLLAPDATLFETLRAQSGCGLSPRADPEGRPDQRPRPAGAGRAGRQAGEGCHCDQLGDGGGSHQPSSGYIPTGRLPQHRPEDRPHPDQQAAPAIPVMLLLLALVFWLTIAGANVPSQWLSTVLFWVEGQLSQLFVTLHAPAWLHGLLVDGCLPRAGLGGVGDAAAYGHLLPAVHSAGGCGVSAAGGLQSGSTLPEMLRLREAGADHLHGVRLQRRRCGGLPHHRLPPGAAAGHPDQQLRPLQRPLPHPDHPADPVFRRYRRRAVLLPPVGAAADRCSSCWGWG